jgi:hypothetical protein
MTLDEIRELLQVRDHPDGNCGGAHALLHEHIAHVAGRIGELQRLQRELTTLSRRCRPMRADPECAILAELRNDARSSARGAPKPHVRGAHRR